MTTQSAQATAPTPAIFIERLQQAIRVVKKAATDPDVVFDIDVYAASEDNALHACIAGLCGFDPWFQEQGLRTRMDDDIGDVSIQPLEFFGTEGPFFHSGYESGAKARSVTFQDGIDALKREIERLQAPAITG